MGARLAALVLALVCCEATYSQQTAVAYRGVTIETIGKAGRIENATLVVRAGKIEAVGTDVTVPETARVVNATGKTITPGWIDPYRVVSIASDNAAPEEARTIVIRGRTFIVPSRGNITSISFTRVADSFYPYDANVRPHLRSGITELNLVARGHGQAAIARVTPDQPATMIENPDGILFASLTNQTSSLDVVRNGLASVSRSGRPPGGSGGGGTPPTGSGTGGPSPRGFGPPDGNRIAGPSVTATREQWQKIYEGKAPLLVNVNNAATILHLMKLLEPYPDVRVLVVATGGNVYQTLDQMRGRKVSLILRPAIDFVPNTRDRVCVPSLVHKAGLEFAFSLSLEDADLTTSQDAPLFPVASLIRAGLPRQTALEALTIRPATMLGLEKTHGSIEPGKWANLLVFDGDPFDPASQLREVLIEGKTVYEN